jgi:hypothetical protein
MKTILILIHTIITLPSIAQISKKLNNQWAFFGNGLVYFEEQRDSLWVDYMEQDSYRFIDFYNFNLPPNEKRELKLVGVVDTVKAYQLTSIMEFTTRFRSKQDTIKFLMNKNNNHQIWVAGKITYDYRENSIKKNSYCDTPFLFCPLLLYDKSKMETIKKLNPIDKITKPHLIAFLNKLEKKLKERCNICNEAFFISDVNEIIMELGYNPVFTYTKGKMTIHKTSALYQLTYLLATAHKDLNERYKKLFDNFYFGERK